MRALRYDRILAGTALALILAIPAGPACAQGESPAGTPPAVTERAMPDPAVPPAMPAGEVTTDPLAALDPADRAIAEKIRDLFAAKSDRIFANKKERAAVEAFYQKRNMAPLWFDKGAESPRAGAAMATIRGADADGL